jgi:hypothetical protein
MTMRQKMLGNPLCDKHCTACHSSRPPQSLKAFIGYAIGWRLGKRCLSFLSPYGLDIMGRTTTRFGYATHRTITKDLKGTYIYLGYQDGANHNYVATLDILARR